MRSPDYEHGEAEFSDDCSHCGAPLGDGEWHPVATETVDGELSLYSFCDEECEAAWRSD